MYFKLIIILLSILITACGDSGDSESKTEPTIPEEQTTVPDSDGDKSIPDSEITINNVLLIIADDLGVDIMNSYGLSTNVASTPTIDALASNGLIFNNAWATPGCTTSRATILSGMHGINSGVVRIAQRLDENLQSLPDLLKANSTEIVTAAFGKWHLSGSHDDYNHPIDTGFDHYYGNLNNIDDYYQWIEVENGVGSTTSVYNTTAITDSAINWINEQKSPWFTYLAYSAPHSPIHLPPANLHSYSELDGSDINDNRDNYYRAMIEAMDTEIGRLLASMNSETLSQTTIIFIGDNGTPKSVLNTDVFANGHGKFTLYEGGVRVPLIISGAGVEAIGFENTLINSTDLYATIAQIMNQDIPQIYDSIGFNSLLKGEELTLARTLNYSEFEGDVSGVISRDQQYKLIQFNSGEVEVYDISNNLREDDNLYPSIEDSIITNLSDHIQSIQGQSSDGSEDITNAIFTSTDANCAAYVNAYKSNVLDVNNSTVFVGDLQIQVVANKCVFNTNAIPNHDFNDGSQAFPNDVSEQNNIFEITTTPSFANNVTELSLQVDNAILLNGVKVDILAAGCFGVGNGKVGCNDMSQPWRYDPMSPLAGFNVDSHNAHAQPDGTYHYHGTPNAFYHAHNTGSPSPVIGFAADGFPIFGPYFDNNGTVRKALPSYQLRNGSRPTDSSSPGGVYDGTFRDDYEYVANSGDLDECNGMTIDGVYGYFISDSYPYVLACFKGTPDPTFNKGGN